MLVHLLLGERGHKQLMFPAATSILHRSCAILTDLSFVLQRTGHPRFFPGQNIVAEGSRGDALWIVARGTLCVMVDNVPVERCSRAKLRGAS